jgi:hypothetical protein
MLKKHKNQLFDLINQSGLDINRFNINEEDERSTVISFMNSPFRFIIRNSSNSFFSFEYQYILFSPNFQMSDIYPLNEYTNFDMVYSEFGYWINNVIKEFLEDQNEPDLWSEYLNGNKSLNFEKIDFGDKESFSLDEKLQIKMSINELKYLIQKHIETTEAEQQIIIDRLDYLVEASTRMNKFDWKSVVVNTLISITITLSLDTQKGQILFSLFKKVFSSLPKLVEYLKP